MSAGRRLPAAFSFIFVTIQKGEAAIESSRGWSKAASGTHGQAIPQVPLRRAAKRSGAARRRKASGLCQFDTLLNNYDASTSGCLAVKHPALVPPAWGERIFSPRYQHDRYWALLFFSVPGIPIFENSLCNHDFKR